MRFLAPRWLLSHLFVIAMVVVMVNLGFWQLRRLDDRRDRNAEIAVAIDRPAVAIEDLLSADPAPPDHTATIVTGTYRPDLELLVANRTDDGRPGSWLVTPVELADGRIVAVSRGWVPRLWVAGVDDRDATSPAGDVAVGGRVFASVEGGRLATSSTGSIPEVSRMDLERVEQATGVDVEALWVQLADQDPPAGDLPVPVPSPGLDEGPHLSYAFQWFFFSTGTVIVYGLILRTRARDPRRTPERQGSSPDTLALLAVRLRGRGTAAEVRTTAAVLAGRSDPELGGAVDDAVADGLVRVRGPELRHSLTPVGDERLAALLRIEAEAVGSAPLHDAHDRFLRVNGRFLESVSAWQLDADPATPAAIAAEVAELTPLLDRLSGLLPRFSGYAGRFDDALERAADDPRWLDAALIDSVHTIWFELHEHLLATVDRSRVDERTRAE